MAAEPAIILFESEMRRTRRSRASGREQVVDDLFSTRGLEADPIPEGADQQFSLRPFAAAVPQDDLVNTEPESNEPTTDRLYRRAADAATKGRVAEAIQRYREILSLEPEHLAARNNLSLLLESAGNPDEAFEQLTAALRARPDEPALLVSRGAILGRLKRYPEAETDLRRAIKLQPGHFTAHLTLGLILWRKGLPGDAALSLRRAIDLEPADAEAHYYLGEALNQAGDFAGARTALEQSAGLDPDSAKTYRLLGRVLDRLGRPDEAKEMYSRAREARDQ
ncbi:MAG TPA: tetratricopeptide repeat protein [Gemmatimonadales bacterium]|jgi:tetratricopeptide (TPR) repeat protein|nr:tetratricopeptide repeat protein [Gemmatimonadales bacterium]